MKEGKMLDFGTTSHLYLLGVMVAEGLTLLVGDMAGEELKLQVGGITLRPRLEDTEAQTDMARQHQRTEVLLPAGTVVEAMAGSEERQQLVSLHSLSERLSWDGAVQTL
jgi:hypothetical protein